MDQSNNRIPTKKELKQLRRLEKLDRSLSEKNQNMVKWIVLGFASILFLAFFIFLVVVSKQNSQKAAKVDISNEGWVRGDKNASVTIAEFSDLQCPACKSYDPIIKQALKEFDGKVKLLYKHYPIPSHKNGVSAAKAAEAAGVQNKFWEMHDQLFDKQEEWSVLDAAAFNDKLLVYANDLNIDTEKFRKDLGDKELEKKITQQQDEGVNLGVNSTPTFFINGEKIENAPQTYDEFKKLITKYIK